MSRKLLIDGQMIPECKIATCQLNHQELLAETDDIARPIPFNGIPGPQAFMPKANASLVASTSSTPWLSTSGSMNVLDVSP